MPKEILTLGDAARHFTVLRIECPRCGRGGQYRIDKVIAEHGRATKLLWWREHMTRDCPRRPGRNADVYDLCKAWLPDPATYNLELLRQDLRREQRQSPRPAED
jgi:hypothetical protein